MSFAGESKAADDCTKNCLHNLITEYHPHKYTDPKYNTPESLQKALALGTEAFEKCLNEPEKPNATLCSSDGFYHAGILKADTREAMLKFEGCHRKCKQS